MEELKNKIRSLSELQVAEVSKIVKEREQVEREKADIRNQLNSVVVAIQELQRLVNYPIRQSLGLPRIRVTHLSNEDQYSPEEVRLLPKTRKIRNVSPGCFTDCDAVLVTTWSDVDQITLGNMLADFVDQGGTVVMCCFANSTNYTTPTGRFDTYHPLVPNIDQQGEVFLGEKIPDHPLMHGVSKITQGIDKCRTTLAVASGAVSVIANWNDGYPLAAIRTDKKGLIISLTFQIGSWGAQGDAIKMVNNALMLY